MGSHSKIVLLRRSVCWISFDWGITRSSSRLLNYFMNINLVMSTVNEYKSCKKGLHTSFSRVKGSLIACLWCNVNDFKDHLVELVAYKFVHVVMKAGTLNRCTVMSPECFLTNSEIIEKYYVSCDDRFLLQNILQICFSKFISTCYNLIISLMLRHFMNFLGIC